MKVFKTNNAGHRSAIKRLTGRDVVSSRATEKVRSIIDAVRRSGDRSVLEYTLLFDKVRLTAREMLCSRAEFGEAAKLVPKDFMATVRRIRKNISDYHKKQLPREWVIDAGMRSRVGEIIRPVETVGIYVPGGAAPLVSTLLMTVVPAKIANAGKIIVATPPDTKGKINPCILTVADFLGVDEIYKIGGAQAIAAMAFGTKTVPKVDKIVGPGNKYVTEAKRQLFGTVDIDCIAGPSEILVLADGSANPGFIAADMLSQAEHGTGDEISLLVTDSADLAENVRRELKRQLAALGRREMMARALREGTFAIVTRDLDEAIEITNDFAPEHLEIVTRKPKSVLKRINNAGAVFIGEYSPVPVGDFIAGPSHVLPTNGAARASSGLSVHDFLKRIGTIEYTKEKLDSVAADIERMALVEGLDAHAETVKIRQRRENIP